MIADARQIGLALHQPDAVVLTHEAAARDGDAGARAAAVFKKIERGLSARGADENSLFGYMKVKGHIERYARELGFPKLVIARPSLLMGERSESRFLEGLSISLAKPLMKPLQRFMPKSAPIQDFELARALAASAQLTKKSIWILENEDLIRLGTGENPKTLSLT